MITNEHTMKLYTLASLLLIPGILPMGSIQAALIEEKGEATQKLEPSTWFTVAGAVRTKEMGLVTQKRIKNAIVRQDVLKVKQLLAKQGTLEKTEKDDLVKKAQDIADQCESSTSFWSNRSDLVMTVAGGAALATGLLTLTPEIACLAKMTYEFIQDSLDPEEIPKAPVVAPPAIVAPPDPNAEAWKVIGYMGSAALIVGGIAFLKRGLSCVKGRWRAQESAKIEQAIYGTVEVGGISLNAIHD